MLRQYFDGRLFLSCARIDPRDGFRLWATENSLVRRFVGRTTDDQAVASDGPLLTIDTNDQDVTFVASGITLRAPKAQPRDHQFLLTNVAFFGASSGRLPPPVILIVPTTPAPTTVTLRPLQDYQARDRLRRHHKLPTPTALLTFSSADAVETPMDFAANLCAALSIVQGHKVNWITYEAIDEEGAPCYKRLQNRITKRSSGLALDRMSGNNRRLPLTAVQECYQKVLDMQSRYEWNGTILEMWLEARTDDDYLETRALKFVTVIEALRTVVLRNEPPRRHLTQAAWESFLGYMIPTARFFLTASLKLNKQQVAAITSPIRWESLNRKSFGSEISTVLGRLGVKEQSRSIRLFVNSRNKLKWGIHFTQVTPIFCGLGSRDFGVPIGNDRAIRGWVNGHSLLHQPVEELAAAA